MSTESLQGFLLLILQTHLCMLQLILCPATAPARKNASVSATTGHMQCYE